MPFLHCILKSKINTKILYTPHYRLLFSKSNYKSVPLNIPLNKNSSSPSPEKTPSPKNNEISSSLKTFKLKNGLSIVTQSPKLPISHITLTIKGGASYEESEFYGQSKFLEFLSFPSSRKTTQFAITQMIEKMGAQYTIESSRDYISYSVSCLPNIVPDVLALFKDSVLNPIFYPHELNNAKFAYSQYISDLPLEVQSEDYLYTSAFGHTGLGIPFIASKKSLDRIDHNSLCDLWGKLFVPQKMSLSAVGVKSEEFLENVLEHFESIPPSTSALKEPASIYTPSDIEIYKDDRSAKSMVTIAMKTCGWNSKDIYAVSVLASLLGGGNEFSSGGPGKGMHSRLYKRVVPEEYCSSCTVYINIHDQVGLFGIQSTCSYDSVSKMMRKMIIELSLLSKESEYRREEVIRAQNSTISSMLINSDNNSLCSRLNGKSLLTYGKVLSLDEMIDKIKQVGVKDLVRVSMKLLREKPAVVVMGNSREAMKYGQVIDMLKI